MDYTRGSVTMMVFLSDNSCRVCSDPETMDVLSKMIDLSKNEQGDQSDLEEYVKSMTEYFW